MECLMSTQQRPWDDLNSPQSDRRSKPVIQKKQFEKGFSWTTPYPVPPSPLPRNSKCMEDMQNVP